MLTSSTKAEDSIRWRRPRELEQPAIWKTPVVEIRRSKGTIEVLLDVVSDLVRSANMGQHVIKR